MIERAPPRSFLTGHLQQCHSERDACADVFAVTRAESDFCRDLSPHALFVTLPLFFLFPCKPQQAMQRNKHPVLGEKRTGTRTGHWALEACALLSGEGSMQSCCHASEERQDILVASMSVYMYVVRLLKAGWHETEKI